jgi:hypothetical protein
MCYISLLGVDPHPHRPCIAVCGIDRCGLVVDLNPLRRERSEAKVIAPSSEQTADNDEIQDMVRVFVCRRRSNSTCAGQAQHTCE